MRGINRIYEGNSNKVLGARKNETDEILGIAEEKNDEACTRN